MCLLAVSTFRGNRVLLVVLSWSLSLFAARVGGRCRCFRVLLARLRAPHLIGRAAHSLCEAHACTTKNAECFVIVGRWMQCQARLT